MPAVRPPRDLVVAIIGPTAIGKTGLSIKLAKKIDGEIISCDSMQVYKGMRILSQAPGSDERREIRHHLIGMVPPYKEYSAADFRRQAVLAISSIIKRGKVPIVTGGSGLYIKALIDGLFPSPKADTAFRNRMQKFVSRYGSKRLHEKLSVVDSEAAAKIHPNDVRRIIRALEVRNSTGRTMTELKTMTRGLADTYNIKIFGLTRASRDGIYDAIDSRVDRMFEEGLVGEVRRLSGKKMSRTAGAALGFKEILGCLKGEHNLEHARSLIKLNTRRFAKRQLTWFRADKRIRWFDLDKVSSGEVLIKIIKEAA